MRAKKTSIEIPRKSPGSVNGRKKRRDIGPRSREVIRLRPYAAAVASSRVTAAVTVATIAEFFSASRNSNDEKTSRYQRRENPSNGNESAPVSWKEKSTT